MKAQGMKKAIVATLAAILLSGTAGFVQAAQPGSGQDMMLPPAITQDEIDKATEVALGHPEVLSLVSGRVYELGEVEQAGSEVELNLLFLEHFQYRGNEIAQLKVFVDIDLEEITGLIVIDRIGRAILTESQEELALEIALGDAFVSQFLAGKDYFISRIYGIREHAVSNSYYTGKPGAAAVLTFDKEYDYKGDFPNPPYMTEKTYYLDGKVKGLTVFVNLQGGAVVELYPNVTSVARPITDYLILAGVLSLGLLVAAGVYFYMRRAGYRESSSKT